MSRQFRGYVERSDELSRRAASLRVALDCVMDQCTPAQIARARTLAMNLGAVDAAHLLDPPTTEED